MAEFQNAIKWFSENKITANLTNWNSLLFKKSNQTSKHASKQFLIGNDVVEVNSSLQVTRNTNRWQT